MKTGTILFFFIMALFLLTNLSDDVGWEDTGELTTSAYLLSISHPTGFPLYMIIVKVFQFLPLGNISYRANLSSLAATYISLLLLFGILQQTTGKRSIGFIAVLAFVLNPHVLLQSSVAEIYSLNLVFIALLLYLMVLSSESPPLLLNACHKLLFISFMIGLAGGIQPTFIIFGVLLFLSHLFDQKRGKGLLSIGHVPWLMLFLLLFLFGFSINLYLPIRGSHALIYHWGPLHNWPEFWDHISAAPYRTGYADSFTFPSPIILWQRLRSLLSIISSGSLTILWPLILLGMLTLRKYTNLKITLWAVFGLDLGYTLLVNPMGIKTLQTSLVSLYCISLFLGFGIEIMMRDSER
ncbi:protein O-mannosyl-transferase family [candidate division CSSED10-310 bacterium]|uniref:Protein O-mannosyl-transferase family n=1 Tax=candidate division CSSED10-310 bacterium TaxID=2855610 RepID=A0ABV6YW98_UNCC1